MMFVCVKRVNEKKNCKEKLEDKGGIHLLK